MALEAVCWRGLEWPARIGTDGDLLSTFRTPSVNRPATALSTTLSKKHASGLPWQRPRSSIASLHSSPAHPLRANS